VGENGIKWKTFNYFCSERSAMVSFIGEYDCKLDPKGRLSVPSGLYKQFDARYRERFIINRSIFQKCLVLYPVDAWEQIMQDLSKLNRFIKENDTFIRMFTNGATQVELDGAGRILIPKKLLDYASAEKDVVLNAHLNKVEIWSKQLFEQGLSQLSDKDFEALAEKVMSKIDPNEQRKLS